MTDVEIMKEVRPAIRAGDTERALGILGADKARLEMMTPFGTWLHVAAAFGRLEIVRSLVAMGADIERRGGTFGGSPINNAASNGHLEVVEFLLGCGASLDVSEPERNPLFSAIQGGHTAVARILIDRGIDTQIAYTGPSMKNMTALAFAHEWGRKDIAALLADS
jgi:ankyrin repeat protein